MQRKYLKMLRQNYGRRMKLVEVPLLAQEVKGIKRIHQVADILQQKLQQTGRESWFAEECQQLVAKYQHKTPDEWLYLGFGSGWKLKPALQGALRHLASWREQTARQHNIPKTEELHPENISY